VLSIEHIIFISLVLIAFNLLIKTIFIKYFGYVSNEDSIIRMLLVGIFIFMHFINYKELFYRFLSIGFSNNKLLINFYILSTVFFSFILFYSLYGYLKLSYISLNIQHFTIILLLFSFLYFNKITEIFKIEINKNIYLILLNILCFSILFTIFLPLLQDKYISNESTISAKAINNIYKKNNFIENLIRIEVKNQNNIENIKNNLTVYSNHVLFRDNIFNDNFLQIYPSEPQLLCLLIDDINENSNTLKVNEYKGFLECYRYFYKLNNSYTHLESEISRFFNIREPNQRLEINKIIKENSELINSETYKILNLSYEEKNSIKYFIGTSFHTGYIGHHFNAILQTINDSDSVLKLGTNQYGFGPLFLIKTIKNLFDFSGIDSLLVSTIFVNLLVFIFLFFYIKKLDIIIKLYIYLGFYLSIAVTMSLSGVMAPLLYHIRLLPTVLLSIILFTRSIDGLKYSVKDYLLIILILLSASFYNFEYGFTLFLALFLSSIKNKKYVYIFPIILLIFCSIIFKSIIPLDVNEYGTNYINYLSRSSKFGSFDLHLFLTIVIIIPIYYFSYKYYSFLSNNFNKTSVFYITLFLLIKAMWVASGNHLASLFLLLSFLIAYFHLFHKENIINKEGDGLISNLFYLTRNLFVYLLFITILVFFHTGKFDIKNNNLIYEKSKFSDIFLISSDVISKVEILESILKPGDVVLDTGDNILSLLLSKRLTYPYWDISSNLNTPLDIIRIKQKYLQLYNEGRGIIINKDLIKPEHDFASKFHMIATPDFTYVNAYIKSKLIYESIQSSLIICDENKIFIRFCIK
jgi:hypothetical protein